VSNGRQVFDEIGQAAIALAAVLGGITGLRKWLSIRQAKRAKRREVEIEAIVRVAFKTHFERLDELCQRIEEITEEFRAALAHFDRDLEATFAIAKFNGEWINDQQELLDAVFSNDRRGDKDNRREGLAVLLARADERRQERRRMTDQAKDHPEVD
jgi:hypothetical protein